MKIEQKTLVTVLAHLLRRASNCYAISPKLPGAAIPHHLRCPKSKAITHGGSIATTRMTEQMGHPCAIVQRLAARFDSSAGISGFFGELFRC
jgi:hypothetical protein